MFELIIHAKAKAGVFPASFAVILSAVALPITLKAEFNFQLICTLPFLFSKVQAAALNPLSVFKTLLKELDRLLIHVDFMPIFMRQSIGALGRRDFYFRPCWQERPLLAGKIFMKAEA